MAKIDESIIQKKIRKEKERIKDFDDDLILLAEKKFAIENKLVDATEEQIKLLKKRIDLEEQVAKKAKEDAEKTSEFYEKNQFMFEQQANSAKSLGDSIQEFVKGIPLIGEALNTTLLPEDFGDELSKQMVDIMDDMLEGDIGFKDIFETNLGASIGALDIFAEKAKEIPVIGGLMSKALKGVQSILMSPLKMGILGVGVAFAAVFTIVKRIRKAARDLGQELGVSTKEARGLLVELKLSEKAFNMIGLDGSKLKTTLGEIGKEFGSMENMTVSNAANIERFAQNAGVSSSEVVKLNKVFMDLDGLSFDAATNVSRVAADLAKAANVNTAKVIQEMSGAAENFAKFSMDGAEGFAKAAVEAAKVGASLNGILSAADGLLKLESSISAQFEAQVLTGKQINLERARQLALDGDIAGLTTEIQSVVGQVGDIQSLNVIQRQSVADAIGISVQDLLRISRGEQVAGQETVLDEQKKTNKILADQYNVNLETLDVAKDKNVNVQSGLF